MTTPPTMRDLAQCLLAYEAMAANSSGTKEPASLRVYEKLRQSLGEFAGAAAFASLASRALALAKPEVPSLVEAQISADGSLRGVGEFEPHIDIDKNQARDDQADERGVVLIARLLGLLLDFLGEALTISLLKVKWPGAVFDDLNSRMGENHEHTR